METKKEYKVSPTSQGYIDAIELLQRAQSKLVEVAEEKYGVGTFETIKDAIDKFNATEDAIFRLLQLNICDNLSEVRKDIEYENICIL